MSKLLILLAIAVYGWKLLSGRWPWEQRVSARDQAVFKARKLLGVEAAARHEDIIAAHRRLVAMVHPDRGGSNAQVHEANDARDLLLANLPASSPVPPKEPS
jgi:DnaJ family protein C protein 19